MKVLVVKLSSLGDVIHTLPALSDAAAARSDIRFDWVVEEAFAEVPRWHRAVETVLPVALRRWRQRPLRDLLGPEARAAHRALTSARYDAVIDAQGLVKSAFVARLVSAPRYGFDWHCAREGLASSVYQHRIRVPRDLHAIQRTRALFAHALEYALPESPPDYGVSTHAPPDASARPPDLVLLHGTARAEKLWPETHWQALAVRAAAAGYTVCLPQGSVEEAQRAQRIAAHANSACTGGRVTVLPQLTLSRIATVLSAARAAVAVDTGLGHLCAALAVPSVSLYGPTKGALVGTCGPHQVHLQSPAGTAARMASITVEAVWAALQSLLAQRARHQQTAGVA